ncbi:MAG: hypothetical protein WBO32_01090 [Cyclobacteriaceae bacterium]
MANIKTDLTLEELKDMFRPEMHIIIALAFECGKNSKSKKATKIECQVTGDKHDFTLVPFGHYYECRACHLKKE